MADSGAQPLADSIRRGWALLQSQRPHAAWASWQSVLRHDPGNAAANEALERLAAADDLPEVARRPLRFAAPAGDEAREAWNKAFGQSKSPEELADPTLAATVFRRILEERPGDAAACWNYAVCLVWAGAQWLAIDALNDVIDMAAAADPDRAADAACLAELLRHGSGAEENADAISESLNFQTSLLRGLDICTILQAYGSLLTFSHPDAPVGTILGELLVKSPQATRFPVAKMASLIATPESIRISQPAGAASDSFLEQLAGHLRYLTGKEFTIDSTVLPIALYDSAPARFGLDPSLTNDEKQALTQSAVSDYFETTWINQQRNSLNELSPLQFSRLKSPEAKARLEGLITFLEQIAARPASRKLYQGYDFDRLRYRLGLFRPVGSIDAKGEARHLSLLWFHSGEVGRHKPGSIDDKYLTTAWETATACHDNKLAIELGDEILRRGGEFLSLVSPVRWLAPYMRQAMAADDLEAGEKALNKAFEIDEKYYSGQHNNEILLWRAQFLTRLYQNDAAFDAYLKACQSPGMPPIERYEAVIDLAENESELGLRFCRKMLVSTENSYVRAMLARWLEIEE